MAEQSSSSELRSRATTARKFQAQVTPLTRTSTDNEAGQGLFKQFATGWAAVVHARNADDLPPSPSGVNEMSKPAQGGIFAAFCAAFGAGTLALLRVLPSLDQTLPAGWYSTWARAWPLGLGPFYFTVGVLHFTLLKAHCGICPGRGAWGFWYLPGAASFHVKWTGMVEIVGGLGLTLGGLGVGTPELLQVCVQVSAATLFVLTVAVTPANIYMFTHGAQIPPGVGMPIIAHAIRGALQCVFLALLYTLATQ